MFFLGGFSIVGIGRVGAQGVYCDLVSVLDGWVYQLYANRKLIGSTREVGGRRVYGQLIANRSPAPLTVLRVDPHNFNTDYGSLIPKCPWNRFALHWTTSGSVGIDHFDIVAGDAPGGSIDLNNVLAKVPFDADGPYSFELDPLIAGTWNFGIVPRSAATPHGVAGSTLTASIAVVLPPDDIAADSSGNRFSLAVAAGVVTASFSY